MKIAVPNQSPEPTTAAHLARSSKNMRYHTLFLIVAVSLLSGCGTLQLSPVANETRAVTAAIDAKKTVSVPAGMVWYDAAPPTRGLRFPPGTYVLEAEDVDYWYLHSPAPLELRVFRDGQAVDSRNIPGGIMIAKHFSMVPGAAYIDGEGSTKMMIWKLGGDFLNREGRDWKKSF
jgi:hypothetical protein